MRETITPLILTYNEASNLPRILEGLTWARQIIVVDSFSTDETLAIARQFPQVKVIQRPFDRHADQWNFGLENCPSDWVLALDADYVLSGGLLTELNNWEPEPGVIAYYSRFAYCVFGRPLRRSLYPPRAILFRRDCCHYYQDGHTQALRINGGTNWLENVVFHDDRKPLACWLAAQDRYAFLEAQKLTRVPPRQLTIQDRIRRCILLAPVFVFLYTLCGKALILDGWAGWYYVFQRTLVELLVSIRLLQALRAIPQPAGNPSRYEECASSRTSVQRKGEILEPEV
jgi:glycosyltransferase involved in cell wall biosynthesis